MHAGGGEFGGAGARRVRLSNVEKGEAYGVAIRGEPGRCGLARGSVPRREHDGEPALGEPAGDRQAEPAVRAGDERGTAGGFRGHAPLPAGACARTTASTSTP